MNHIYQQADEDERTPPYFGIGEDAHVIRLATALVWLASLALATPALALKLERAGVPSLAPLLDQVTPAVVNISVLARANAPANPLFRDPFFRRFFDMPEQRQRPERSAGSGVIIDAENGYVVTNHHVIENAIEVQVTLKDRRRLKANIIGSDPGTDIALLKVSADDLTDIPIGNSDKLDVGDFVIAIGNPFGLGQTVTSGIVSALGRSGLNVEGYEDFIQTDASINPGNSGGALVNLRGELIGINTAIIGPANVGIGFAVPTRITEAVISQLQTHGAVRRGQLGVIVQDLTPDLAEALNLSVRNGAVLSRIRKDSSADRAGLRPGDVVVKANGRDIRDSADLRAGLGLIRAGSTIALTVLRDGKSQTIEAVLEAPNANRIGSVISQRLQGATFRAMQPSDPQFGEIEGVVVERAEEGSPAWYQGLRPGDLILAVNRRRVTNVTEFEKLLELGRRAVALTVIRGNARIFIVIQ